MSATVLNGTDIAWNRDALAPGAEQQLGVHGKERNFLTRIVVPNGLRGDNRA